MTTVARFGRKLKLLATVQIKHQMLKMWLADIQEEENRALEKQMETLKKTTADGFRRRAADIGKGMASRRGADRAMMMRKQAALIQLANNEDWLDGTSVR